MQRSELGSRTLVIWMVMAISSPSLLLRAFRATGCGARWQLEPREGPPVPPDRPEQPHPARLARPSPGGAGWAGRGWSHRTPSRPPSPPAAPSAWRSARSCTPPQGCRRQGRITRCRWQVLGPSPLLCLPTRPRSGPQKPHGRRKPELVCFAAPQQLCPPAPWPCRLLHLAATGTGRHGGLCPGAPTLRGAAGGPRPHGPAPVPEGDVVLVDSFVLAVDLHRVQPHVQGSSLHHRLCPRCPRREGAEAGRRAVTPAGARTPKTRGWGSPTLHLRSAGGRGGPRGGCGRQGGPGSRRA